MSASSEALQHALAPTGVLRASIILGNPILARRESVTGEPAGVAVDLTREIASRLGVEVSLVLCDRVVESVEVIATEAADIGFFAFDPVRDASIAFTPPFIMMDGYYLVRDVSPITSNEQVDRDGVRVVVTAGTMPDFFLRRQMRYAQIANAASGHVLVETFLRDQFDVAAALKPQLEVACAHTPGLRLLPERFVVIPQSIALPKSRGEDAARALSAFVEDAKRSGFIAQALARHRIKGASVAAPSGVQRNEAIGNVVVNVTEQPDATIESFIGTGVEASMLAQLGPKNVRPLSISFVSGDDFLGGLSAVTAWDWLVIKGLWIREDMRGHGLGSHALLAAVSEGKKRGCRGAWLDTFNPEARLFYERHGFSVFGEVPDYRNGQSYFFMQKRL